MIQVLSLLHRLFLKALRQNLCNKTGNFLSQYALDIHLNLELRIVTNNAAVALVLLKTSSQISGTAIICMLTISVLLDLVIIYTHFFVTILVNVQNSIDTLWYEPFHAIFLVKSNLSASTR